MFLDGKEKGLAFEGFRCGSAPKDRIFGFLSFVLFFFFWVLLFSVFWVFIWRVCDWFCGLEDLEIGP